DRALMHLWLSSKLNDVYKDATFRREYDEAVSRAVEIKIQWQLDDILNKALTLRRTTFGALLANQINESLNLQGRFAWELQSELKPVSHIRWADDIPIGSIRMRQDERPLVQPFDTARLNEQLKGPTFAKPMEPLRTALSAVMQYNTSAFAWSWLPSLAKHE